MATTPKLMTADEFARLPRGRERHQLVRGVLHTMPLIMWIEATVISNVMRSMQDHNEGRRLGAVLGNVGFQLTTDPDTVRSGSVVFMRQDRVPPRSLKGYVPGAPDLVVEVVSPSDLYLDMAHKIEDWLEHGTQIVFVITARRRQTVVVHRPGQRPEALGMDDVLTGEDVMPGWSLAVRDVFDQD